LLDGDLFLREPAEDFRGGTFPPFCRASLNPMAMACFRLFTLAPELLFNVPFFRRCMADFTRSPAAFPYFFAIRASPAVLAKHVLILSRGTNRRDRIAPACFATPLRRSSRSGEIRDR